MLYRFKSFDPIVGVAPIAFGWHGNDIVERARALLHKRNREEFEAAIHVVNWLLDSIWVEDVCAERVESLARWLEVGSEARGVCDDKVEDALPAMHARNIDSSCFCLSLCVGHFDLSARKTLPGLAWYELFAVLALGIVDRAMEDEDYYDSLPVQSEFHHLWRCQTHVADWLIEAMDAVATAEGLLKLDRLGRSDDVIKDGSSAPRVTRAEVEEHAVGVNVLLDLFEYYRAGHFNTYEQAVEQFLQLNEGKGFGMDGQAGWLRAKLAKLVRGK